MTEIIIRPIRESDGAGFHATLDAVAKEGMLARSHAPPLEITAAFIRKNIADGHVQMVAEAQGIIVGWCDILPRQAQGADTGVVGMGVLREYRGRGIGKELLSQALIAIGQKKFQRIELTVRADNLAAINLYKKHGFIVEAHFQREEQGKVVPLFIMSLKKDANAA